MKIPDDLSPRFAAAGESGLLIELSADLSFEINQVIWLLDSQLKQTPLPGVETWVPAYASLLVLFDPIELNITEVQNWVMKALDAIKSAPGNASKLVEIEVSYGGENGPDLEAVANFHHISPLEVVRLHTAPLYHVGMIGFTPGFAYLLGLDSNLATPRLSTPRSLVPAGSVGIGGMQTGIYPFESPGGWQLIGRTGQVLFDPNRSPSFLLSPGDEVRFIAVEDGACK